MFNSAQRAANKVAKLIAKEQYDDATTLLGRGVSAEGVYKHKRYGKISTLSLAVIAGKPDLVSLLLEKGADVRRRNASNHTALYYLYACKDNSETTLSDIVTHFVQAGADIDEGGRLGVSPLLASVYYDSSSAAEAATLVLLRHGASPLRKHDDSHSNALHRSVMCYRSQSTVIRALIAAGCPVNDKNQRGQTPLHYAAEYGVSENIRALLDGGADPYARDNDLRTPADVARNAGIASFISEYEERHQKITRPAAGWVKVSQDEIAMISDKTAIGYQLTEIFNFSRGEVTLISRNLSSGAEGVTVRGFGQLADDASVRAAQEQLRAMKGMASVPGKRVSLIERKSGNGLV